MPSESFITSSKQTSSSDLGAMRVVQGSSMIWIQEREGVKAGITVNLVGFMVVILVLKPILIIIITFHMVILLIKRSWWTKHRRRGWGRITEWINKLWFLRKDFVTERCRCIDLLLSRRFRNAFIKRGSSWVWTSRFYRLNGQIQRTCHPVSHRASSFFRWDTFSKNVLIDFHY